MLNKRLNMTIQLNILKKRLNMTIQLYIAQYGFKYYYLKNTQDSNSMAYSIYNQKLILFLLLPVMIPVETPPPPF